ncbi:hypothetical protein BD780_003905 [Clostridium tetanomorphum]|nr:DUF4230 domain-containing protein [Clostridium tetanomorphum]NRS86680.1 hypothetical protein [Clostridium tetanomorphum]
MTKSIEKMSRKSITSEAIINKIHEKKELIIMEAELSDKVVLDDSWGNFAVFKKITYINFNGKGIYTVDLSKIKAENITMQPNIKTIYINVPKPEIKSITINEEKTSYETEKGILRFGEITLSPAENQIMTQKVKERMKEKLSESDMINKALINTKKSIKEIILSVLNNKDSDYTIVVYIEK